MKAITSYRSYGEIIVKTVVAIPGNAEETLPIAYNKIMSAYVTLKSRNDFDPMSLSNPDTMQSLRNSIADDADKNGLIPGYTPASIKKITPTTAGM